MTLEMAAESAAAMFHTELIRRRLLTSLLFLHFITKDLIFFSAFISLTFLLSFNMALYFFQNFHIVMASAFLSSRSCDERKRRRC